MNLLLLLSTVFTAIALYFVFSLCRHVRRRRPIRATGSLAAGVVSGVAGSAAILLAFSYYGYDRLVAEQQVSRIEFSESAPGEYTARVMINGKQDRFFELRGDEWQMDARVVTWKPPVTLLGLDPIYQLDRISGRYADIDDERTAQRTIYALSDELAFDVWRVARRFPLLMPGVDAYYGTATYLPMADGAQFDVSLSRTALIARPVNEPAREAVGMWEQ
jgi:hypothetical protein